MKTLKVLMLSAATAAALFLSSCASTDARIRRNPELFAQLAPEQQDLIRHGQVAIGFNAEMVRLALGEPDRFSTRQDADGTSEIWSYVTYDADGGYPLYRGWYHRYYMWGDPLYPYYENVAARHVHDRFRVIFKNGLVSALESETTR